ncbi:hypothetical protein OIU77_015511 [Salix suchowensis]|uniref:Uncharacterized protein n=1 Tax=Salix suchowensis TaxID=1278906 RepID=A0ABQ8ZH94_9ROSI|nr:hypothetical protein OIU77_015511 [Salix suchowensis]
MSLTNSSTAESMPDPLDFAPSDADPKPRASNSQDWWRNEQFWLTGGTSSHIVAVLQELLKVIAGIEITFTLTSKSASDEDGGFADLYTIKWSFLMIPPPITVIILNMIGIAIGACRTKYGVNPQWGQLVGGVFFSFWVLAHLYS